MKRILTYLFACALLTSQLHAQLSFQNTSAGGNDFLFSTLPKSDGGFMALGYTTRFGAGDFDFYLINIDAEGNFLWSKAYGGENNDLGYAIAPTEDDGFILAGASESFGGGGADVLMIKIDSDGAVIWSKTFGGIGWDEAFEICPVSDGGFLLAGRTTSYGAGAGDIYCIKTDATGIELWNKTYGGINNEDAQQVRQTNDGGFIIVGHTGSFGAGNTDVYLIKIDPSGNIEWSKTYGGSDFDYGNSVQQTSDGGYVVSGQTNSFDLESSEALLLKIDNSGNLIWSKTYGGTNTDYSHYVIQNPDDGFTLTGQTNSFGGGGFDAIMIRTDVAGDTLWTRTYGGAEDDFSNAVDFVPDEDAFLFVGNTWSFGNQSRAYVVMADSMGNSGCHEFSTTINIGLPSVQEGVGGLTDSGIVSSTPTVNIASAAIENNLLCMTSTSISLPEAADYLLFPNPIQGAATLRFTHVNTGAYTFVLFDINGRQVQQDDVDTAGTIELKNLSSGLYIFHLISEAGHVLVGKMVVQ